MENMITFLEPWYPVDDDEKIALEKEFKKELHTDHILNGKQLTLIGRRCDQDDVLFSLIGSDEVAVVHLTWSGRNESGRYPLTMIRVCRFDRLFHPFRPFFFLPVF